MLRRCKDCGLEAHSAEDLELFRRSKRSPHGRHNLCKVCANTRNKQRQQRQKDENGTSLHPSQIRRYYGCELEQYLERMASSSACMCCGSVEKLCYDHNHDTMAFRGVLCQKCNKGIGLLGDNIEGLKNALAYLEHHQAQQDAG